MFLAGYADYDDADHIRLHVGAAEGGPTLEPQLLYANGREVLNALLGRDAVDDAALEKWMKDNKTSCALALFETDHDVKIPSFIRDAVV